MWHKIFTGFWEEGVLVLVFVVLFSHGGGFAMSNCGQSVDCGRSKFCLQFSSFSKSIFFYDLIWRMMLFPLPCF